VSRSAVLAQSGHFKTRMVPAYALKVVPAYALISTDRRKRGRDAVRVLVEKRESHRRRGRNRLDGLIGRPALGARRVTEWPAGGRASRRPARGWYGRAYLPSQLAKSRGRARRLCRLALIALNTQWAQRSTFRCSRT
jgi:hypothetical protein